MSDEPLDPIAVEGVDYGKSTLFRFSMMTESVVKSDTAQLPFRIIAPWSGFTYTGNDTLHSLNDIKALNEGLYYFGEWLASDDFDPDFSEISLRIAGVHSLDQTNLGKLWNSLYKKFDTSRQDSVVKNLVNMMRAHAFAFMFNEMTAVNPELSDSEKTELIRTRKAPLRVIQAVLTGEIPITPPAPAPRPVRPRQRKTFKNRQTAAVAQHQEKTLSKNLRSFRDARMEYSKAYNKAHAEAARNFEQNLSGSALFRAASESLPTDEEAPVFTFEFPPFDLGYIESMDCYANVAETITEFTEHHDFCGNLDNLESYLEKNIQTAQGQYRNNYTIARPKRAMFKKYEIVYDDSPENNSLVAQVVKLLPNHSKSSIIITHYSKDNLTKIGKITGTANPSVSDPVTFSTSKIIHEDGEYTTFVVAENAITPGDDDLILSITAYEEDDGEAHNYQITLKDDFYGYVLPSEDEAPLPIMMRTSLTSEGSQMYGIQRLGFKEYLKVEQEVCCYVPGEVSHIENVMAREYRKKLVRDLERHEITTEESEESESERTTDNSTTDRYEMQKEISQMLTKEQSRQIGITAGMNASFSFTQSYKLDVNAGTNLNFSSSSSQTDNYNQAENIAKEVVQKATDRVVRKMSYKRTARMLREHEETNEHGFDNRNGTTHFVGIYRWVDKIYKNTVFNYGKRLQYDFMLPEPAKSFKYWMTSEDTTDTNKDRPEPKHPKTFVDEKVLVGTTFNWKHIEEENYAQMAAEYGADVEPMPEKELRIAKSFSENPKDKFPISWDEPRGSFNYEIEIPEGYYCNNFWSTFGHVIGHKGTGHQFSSARIIIDMSCFYYIKPFIQSASDIFVTNDSRIEAFYNENKDMRVTKAVPIGISTFNIGGFSLNVVTNCLLTEDAKNSWKQRTYLAIMDAYRKRLQEWIDANPEEENTEEAEVDYITNPGSNRVIEAKELKRLCIEMMTDHLSKSDFPDSYYRDGYIKETDKDNSDSYKLALNQNLDKHAYLVNFLEQAFEWDLISYQFYAYMYAGKQSWKSLVTKHKSSGDPLFEAFLQSGMAKLTLTVTPGFERKVMFFLDKGIIPASNDFIPEGSEEWYQSVSHQLVVDEKKPVGESWETRVPTNLIILQADAAPLRQIGLPCACPQSDNEGIAVGESALDGNTINNAFLISNIKDALIEVLGHLAPIISCGGGNPGSGGSGAANSGFQFPKHTSLTTDDIGKLVVNGGDGKASVAILSPAIPPQKGKFKIRLEEIGDLDDDSKVHIQYNDYEYTQGISRLDWRNGNVPTTVEEELTLLKNYIEGISNFAYLTLTIEGNALVLEEDEIKYTRIELEKFHDSIYIVRPSTPETPPAFTGYPLGKLIGISGNNALIGNGMVETFTLGSPFTVNQNFFLSDGDFDLENFDDLLNLLNHIIIPADEGKVKPISLSVSDLNDHFLNTFRNQFVGIGIASSGTEVTVAKLPHFSLLLHTFRRLSTKGMLGGD